jgi:tetratricopeptide (TPR) repeat protein
LGDRQCLLVLDRADEIDDIAELLPSPVDCAVLLTTRQPLMSLKRCRNISLKPIDSNSALELLAFLIGRDRVQNEHQYAQAIVEAASGMPFALQAVAACLTLRPACDLRTAVDRMHAVRISGIDLLPPACRAYDLCFAHLTLAQRTVLLRIALLASTQFEPWMLTALTDDDESDWTSQAIDGLARARLIERAPDAPAGRLIYQVPDQTAAYARFRSAAEFSSTDRAAARDRLAHAKTRVADKPVASNYIHSLIDAGQLTTALDITRQAIQAIRENAGGHPYRLTPLSADGADEVCPAGSASASEQVAAAAKSISRITALFAELHTELCLDDAETLAREAIELGMAAAPASAFRCLGLLEALRHRHTQAEYYFEDALLRARDDGDSAECIRILRELAIARSQSSQPVEAIQPAEDAIALASSADKLRPLIDSALWAQGIALHANNRLEEADRVLLKAAQTAAESGHALRAAWADQARANVLLDAGRNSPGVDLALRAMDHFVQIRHRYGIARCRLLIAQVLNAEGKPQEAALAYEDAIGTLRTCDDKWREAMAMRALAETLIDAQPKRTVEIARLLTGASAIFRRLGDFAAVKDTQGVMSHLEGPR